MGPDRSVGESVLSLVCIGEHTYSICYIALLFWLIFTYIVMSDGGPSGAGGKRLRIGIKGQTSVMTFCSICSKGAQAALADCGQCDQLPTKPVCDKDGKSYSTSCHAQVRLVRRRGRWASCKINNERHKKHISCRFRALVDQTRILATKGDEVRYPYRCTVGRYYVLHTLPHVWRPSSLSSDSTA